MGEEGFQAAQNQTPISTDETIQAYVSCVVNAIFKANSDKLSDKWNIVVLESKQSSVMLAPRRNIGIYTGFLKLTQNDAELAVILSQSIGNILEGATVAKFMKNALAKDKSTNASDRFHARRWHQEAREKGADTGFYLMANSGFDPSLGLPILERIVKASTQKDSIYHNALAAYQRKSSYYTTIFDKAIEQGAKPSCPKPEL